MDLIYTHKEDYVILYCPSCKDLTVFEVLKDVKGEDLNGIATRKMSIQCTFCHLMWKDIVLYITHYMTLFFNHYLERAEFPESERPK